MIRSTYDTGLPKIELASVENTSFAGPSCDIPCRIYTPHGAGPHPITMFFHGSGFCVLDLDSHDDICRWLCNGSESVVVSVDYRLAPENPFPAGNHDCTAAVLWFASRAHRYNADPSRIAVSGDSAGGCMAALTALQLRDEGGPALAGQLLFYPVTDHYSSQWRSYDEFGEGYGLSASLMTWFWNNFIGTGGQAAVELASPLRAQTLFGMPPALIQVAEYDVLRDEGEIYAEKLSAAGVEASVTRCEGLNHGFLRWIGILPEVTQRMDDACRWLHRTLRPNSTWPPPMSSNTNRPGF
ncbi:MAG: alpha/beta hydrolase [Mesorhizobium sp.]|nr:alpha/beta hydrolase [Mesorhizobium sp.]MCO5164152.1 alpha/beta hydrolase [Mesorhizobium sp.]